MSEMTQGHFLASVSSFERAIQIDPNFATAYITLAVAFEQAGDTTRQAKYADQAFRLIDRVSEYERAEISAYHYRVTGELDKEIDAYQLGIRNHNPQSWSFHNQLAVIYVDAGQYEEGLKEGREAARLEPNAEAPYRRQLDAYICLDRLPEAKQLAEKLRAQGLDGVRIHQRFLEMAYVEGDLAAIARETQWFAAQPEEYLSFGLQAANRNAHGQRRESHKLYQRAAETALRRGLRDTAAEFDEADALADALAGNCQTARSLGRPAVALAMCGDAAGAEKLAAETSKLLPAATIWNAVQLPEIRAARLSSITINPPEAWNCWHPPPHTSDLTSMRLTSAAWRTCVCIKARRQRLSSRKSRITRARVGERPGSIRIGDCIIRRPIWG